MTGALAAAAIVVDAPTPLTYSPPSPAGSPPGFAFPAGAVASAMPGFVAQLEGQREL